MRRSSEKTLAALDKLVRVIPVAKGSQNGIPHPRQGSICLSVMSSYLAAHVFLLCAALDSYTWLNISFRFLDRESINLMLEVLMERLWARMMPLSAVCRLDFADLCDKRHGAYRRA